MKLKQLLLFILIGVIKNANSDENNAFDLRLEKVEVENTNLSGKKGDLKDAKVPSLDDHNLSKKRSFYSESSMGSDYSEKFLEPYEYISKEKNNLKEIDKNILNRHHDELNWERNRNKLIFLEDLEDSRNVEKIKSNKIFKGNQNFKTNYDWENRNNFFEVNRPHLHEGSTHFNSALPAINVNRDTERHSSFVLNNKIPRKKPSTYNLNNLHNDFLSGYDLYHTDTPFIINIKTECPSSKLSKNRVMHKFVFAPKARLRSQSESPFHASNFHDFNQISSPLYYR